MTNSDRAQIASETYDLIVIGGGITGAGIVRDASMRGLKCLLLEKSDFSSGTSSRSGKLIHGGLRYLRYFHLKLVFESCQERLRLLKHVAPHLVSPTKFTMLFYRWSKTPRWLATLGAFFYDLLSLFRNVGRFKLVEPRILQTQHHDLERLEMVGGLSYWDAKALDFRLVIDTLKSAVRFGAKLLNYCEVEHIQLFARKNARVTAKDLLTGESFTFTTTTIINAAGPWADDVLERAGSGERFGLKLVSGSHIVLERRLFSIDDTFGVEAPQDGRNLYIVPWGEYVLVGTTDTHLKGDKESHEVPEEHLEYLLKVVNTYFPKAQVGRNDIVTAYVGIRPLIGSDKNKNEDKIPRDFEIKLDPRGMLSITGGKLTTYRAMAKRAVDLLVKSFFKDKNLKGCRTLEPLIPENEKASLRVGAMEANQIRKIVEEEFCFHLDDFFVRRTDIFLFSKDKGKNLLPEVAKVMASVRGWDAARTQAEIDSYLALVKKKSF